MEEIKLGIYKHFKGGIYEVLCIAKNSETLEDMVVYKSLKDDSIWVRPLSMWNEIVIKNNQEYKRFTYIANKDK